jgi:ribosomal protein S27E
MVHDGDTLVIHWDGQRIGCLGITEVRHFPALTDSSGKETEPPRIELSGQFSPDPAFTNCRSFFEELNRREQVYDDAPCGEESAAALEAMGESIRAILSHVSFPELQGRVGDFYINVDGGWAWACFVPGAAPDDRRLAPRATSEDAHPATAIPSHLVGWATPIRVDGLRLEAALCCPCGCAQLEFHYPGQTLIDTDTGMPAPCAAELRQRGQKSRFVFAIKAVCTACRQEQVLFDKDLHGWTVVVATSLEHVAFLAALPRPRLWPWRCLDCGSKAHEGSIGFIFEDKREFLQRTDAELPAAMRFDAFTSFGMDIRCSGCGLRTEGWISYEIR